MRSVGIREIKNRLSEYLRYVASGETVLVTHHGRVVAQLAPPPVHAPPAPSEDEALRRLAAAGKIRLPGKAIPSPGEGPIEGIPTGVDVASALAAVRADRSALLAKVAEGDRKMEREEESDGERAEE
ncbi:MAG: type II toxin-antitoxin system prevent-host-death family antitoxin [Gemmatimonadota bacterium]